MTLKLGISVWCAPHQAVTGPGTHRTSHRTNPGFTPPSPIRTHRNTIQTPEEKYRNLSYLFNYYLHQDWTIEGETLSAVFEQNEALHEISKRLRKEAELLLEEGHSNRHLDDIFFGRWGAGYEPEAEGHETWQEVLEDIIRFSKRHTKAD